MTLLLALLSLPPLLVLLSRLILPSSLALSLMTASIMKLSTLFQKYSVFIFTSILTLMYPFLRYCPSMNFKMESGL